MNVEDVIADALKRGRPTIEGHAGEAQGRRLAELIAENPDAWRIRIYATHDSIGYERRADGTVAVDMLVGAGRGCKDLTGWEVIFSRSTQPGTHMADM